MNDNDLSDLDRGECLPDECHVQCDVLLADYRLQFDRQDARLTPLEQKRRLQANMNRNQAIASIAEACRHRDQETLAKYRLFSRAEELPPVVANPGYIVVWVDSWSHGEQLHELLPRFSLVGHSQTAAADGDGGAGVMCEIVTTLAVQGYGEFRPSILINAVGGSWVPNVERLVRPCYRHQMILIDLDDQFDQFVAGDTDRRIARYRLLAQKVHSARRQDIGRSPLTLALSYSGRLPNQSIPKVRRRRKQRLPKGHHS